MFKNELLKKYLSGKPLDIELWTADINEDPGLRITLEKLTTLSRQEKYGPDVDKILTAVLQHARKQKRLKRFRRLAVAAGILLIISSRIFLWPVSENVMVSSARTDSANIQVKPHRVLLVLGDGKLVDVSRIKQDSVITEAAMNIHINKNERISYSGNITDTLKSVYNTLKVPKGHEFQLTLADGSQVWLNSSSSLRFPVHFTKEERRVFLKGEAYFKVERDESSPFRVVAEEMTVEVLGTEFNVNAYCDYQGVTATLAEGKIRVRGRNPQETRNLIPGEQAELHPQGIQVRQVDVQQVTAWKKGRFEFYHMPLEKITCQLERWYDVTFVFQREEVKKYPFSGIIKRHNSLQQALDMIKETTEVTFEINGQQIVVR